MQGREKPHEGVNKDHTAEISTWKLRNRQTEEDMTQSTARESLPQAALEQDRPTCGGEFSTASIERGALM